MIGGRGLEVGGPRKVRKERQGLRYIACFTVIMDLCLHGAGLRSMISRFIMITSFSEDYRKSGSSAGL